MVGHDNDYFILLSTLQNEIVPVTTYLYHTTHSLHCSQQQKIKKRKAAVLYANTPVWESFVDLFTEVHKLFVNCLLISECLKVRLSIA